MRKHLDRFRKDKDGKFRLILIESRIHRLARYYKVRRPAPPPCCVPPASRACARPQAATHEQPAGGSKAAVWYLG